MNPSAFSILTLLS